MASTEQLQKPATPSSRLSQLYIRHRNVLQRLDDLESRIASRVAAHRRRATNLIEETPKTRRTHMRIFISHRVEDENIKKEEDTPADDKKSEGATGTSSVAARGGKDFKALLSAAAHHGDSKDQAAVAAVLNKDAPKRKWTLVIEGGLLVGHLDHESAKEVDRRLDAGLPILGCIDGSNSSDGKDDTNDGIKNDAAADNGDGSKSTTDGSSGSLSPVPTPSSSKAVIPLRDQWRGGVAEREGELVIDPVIFTHLFDRMEVQFTTTKQTEGAPAGDGNVGPVQSVKTIAWERVKANTPDSHAFFIAQTELGTLKPSSDDGNSKVMKAEFSTDYIDAKIKLYRRQGENYVPSEQMCNVFFPTFIGKMAKEMKMKELNKALKKNKKRKRSLNEAMMDASTPSSKDAASADSAAPSVTASDTNTSAAAEEKDISIPNTVTMDEALGAVFYYIRTRGLQDSTDLSIINNDETLSQLFGCNRMLLSAVRGLLLQKELLVKVEHNTHPIIFNYRMTLDGAEPLSTTNPTNKPSPKATDASETQEIKPDEAPHNTRRRSLNDNDASQASKKDPNTNSGTEAIVPMQTMLSCDVDIDIPSLFHTRIRDILRRTKYREFEYSGHRNKASKYLIATKVDEETAKVVLEDVVTGKGYAPYHKHAWMSLARGAHEGGEAQRAAWIDLRTTSLIEKLEERCSAARGYWDVVNACRGL